MLENFTKWRMKYEQLMEGRHGIDSLSKDLFILWIIVGFLNTFIRSRIVSFVALIIPIIALLRMLSANSVKRSIENRKYLKFRTSAIEFFKVQRLKFKDRKTHKYYKCKNCSAYIRVKRQKGEHTIDCPKCGKEIRVKIR